MQRLTTCSTSIITGAPPKFKNRPERGGRESEREGKGGRERERERERKKERDLSMFYANFCYLCPRRCSSSKIVSMMYTTMATVEELEVICQHGLRNLN